MCRSGNNSSTESACGGACQGLDPCRSEQQDAQNMCLKPSLWHYVLRELDVKCEKTRGLRDGKRRKVNEQEARQARKSVDSAVQVLQRLPRGQVVCIGSKENKQSKCVNGVGRAGKSKLNPTVTGFVPAAARALHRSTRGQRVIQEGIVEPQQPRRSGEGKRVLTNARRSAHVGNVDFSIVRRFN